MRVFHQILPLLSILCQVVSAQVSPDPGLTLVRCVTSDDSQNHLTWQAAMLCPYQLEGSSDLINWSSIGSQVVGNNDSQTVVDERSDQTFFYRLRLGAVRAGFDQYSLPRNDDGYTPDPVPFGFAINLFGTILTSCYINNNGNVTFNYGLYNWTPNPLQKVNMPMIAPFWADVDTRGPRSDVVYYGTGTVNGHAAFGGDWRNVGYYSRHDDKLNDFQFVLIDRSDIGEGNCDIEFNYNHILWETGDASGGTNGYGGSPSRSGLTNGLDSTIELAYSGVTLVQLDANSTSSLPNYSTGLIYRSRNSTIPGRFVFQVRGGEVLGALTVSAGANQVLGKGTTTTTLSGAAGDPNGGAITVQWTVFSGSSDVTISDPNILNPLVTVPDGESAVFQLTVTSVVDPEITASDIVRIN